MQKVRMTAPVCGCFHRSQMPAIPNGRRPRLVLEAAAPRRMLGIPKKVCGRESEASLEAALEKAHDTRPAKFAAKFGHIFI